MLDSHLIVKTHPKALPENIILWKDLRITLLNDRLFRIESDPTHTFCNEATQSVWFRNLPAVTHTVTEGKGTLTVSTEQVSLHLTPDLAKASVTVDGKKVLLSKIKNLPGAYRSLDRCNGNLYREDDGSYTPIRLEDGVVSECGVGLHDDSDALLLSEDGKLKARSIPEIDRYVFAYGKNFREALRALFAITGRVPLIPRYALGNWWSRYHQYSDSEYLHILDALADRDIPLTVATIDMDWHWSVTLEKKKQIEAQGKNDAFHGGNSGWTGYSWNTDLFPDYKAFLKKIQDRNLKITLNLHPADGIRYFEDMYEDMAKAVGIDPKTEQQIPFDFTSDDFINAYFKILHKPYEADGVEFWWIDWQQGTQTSMPGLDPLWALNHYHTLDHASNHTPLILSRYCRIGSHRYPLGFSGDTHVTWKSLSYIPYFTAMGTNAGYTWWSHDIGGHFGGIKDDQLYTRYLQFGAFSPINRLHCSNSPVMTKEPAVYMNGTGLIAEEFLRLRHRMIPYLYSAAYNTNVDGAALIEPMYYGYPEEKDAYRCRGQYLFGGDLIVAPIDTRSDRKGMTAKKVWLPEGHWTDLFTGDEYVGGRWVETVRWLDTIPVLAKEGSFFLLDGRKHTNSIENPDRLNVAVFNGTGAYTLHEDRDGSWMHTSFRSELTGDTQTVTFQAEGDLSVVPNRAYRLEFRNIVSGRIKVYADGKEMAFDTDLGDYLTVILPHTAAGVEYRVEVTFTQDTKERRNASMMYTLLRIEGGNSARGKLRKALKDLDNEEFAAAVNEMSDLTVNEKKRLLESLLSF